MYIRLLTDSQVLSESLMKDLNLFGTLESTLNELIPAFWTTQPTPEVITALQAAIASINQQQPDPGENAIRFAVQRPNGFLGKPSILPSLDELISQEWSVFWIHPHF
jgi:hypothetical protein